MRTRRHLVERRAGARWSWRGEASRAEWCSPRHYSTRALVDHELRCDLRDDEVLVTWRGGIAAVAACPNVSVKLGGIGMPRTGFDWHARSAPIGSEELAASMAPFMTYCIEQFGPTRCMFESNFPVDKVSYSYNVMYNAFKRLSKGYSAAERAAMFHDTAARVYRIDV